MLKPLLWIASKVGQKMKNKNIEIAEAPAYRHKAVALIAHVVMPVSVRAALVSAIEAVRLPLYQCVKLRRSELWGKFKNKVLQACSAVLDNTAAADGKRIYRDLVKILGD